jgi:hypothetical protein
MLADRARAIAPIRLRSGFGLRSHAAHGHEHRQDGEPSDWDQDVEHAV